MMKLDIMRNTGEVWELIDGKPTKINKETKIIGPIITQKLEIVKTFEQELDEIKGIGKETIEDIKRIYRDKQELVDGLKNNKVPLRNDIVEKLKALLYN